MTHPNRQNIRSFWNELASTRALASAIDPADTLGHKNKYISHCRNEALRPFLKKVGIQDFVLTDIGCGTATFLDWVLHEFPNARAFGLDISMDMLRLASDIYPKLQNSMAIYDGEQTPIRDASVDVVTTAGVLLYRLDDSELDTTARQFHRILKPGGVVLSVEQIRKSRRLFPNQRKVQRSPSELLDSFQRAGFSLKNWHQIRRGRFPLTYLIRYGFVPQRLMPLISRIETRLWEKSPLPVLDYSDAVFAWEKPAI